MKYSAWFTINTGMVGSCIIQDFNRKIFVPLFFVIAGCHFQELLIVAWVCSGIRAFFVVECFNDMPSISTNSCITLKTKTPPSSIIMSVGKKACLVMVSIMTFALFTVVGLENG